MSWYNMMPIAVWLAVKDINTEIHETLDSGADKQKNCSLFDKSTKIGIHIILIELK